MGPTEPVNPKPVSPVMGESPDISRVENLVAAAQQEAAAASPLTQSEQFQNQFGGQTPIDIGRELSQKGIPIYGTSFSAIDCAENKEKFRTFLKIEPAHLVHFTIVNLFFYLLVSRNVPLF